MFGFNPEKAKNVVKATVLGAVGLTALQGGEAEAQNSKEKKVEPFVTSNYDEYLERKQAHDDSLLIATDSQIAKKQLLDPQMTSNVFDELKKKQDTDSNLLKAFKNLNYPKPVETIEKKLPDEFSFSGLFKGLGALYGISDGPIEQAHKGIVKIFNYPKQEVVYQKPLPNKEQSTQKVPEKQVVNIKDVEDLQNNTSPVILQNKKLEDLTKEKTVVPKVESRFKPTNAITFETSTTNVVGGKGQYVHYDSAGVPNVITKQEFDRLRELGTKVID